MIVPALGMFGAGLACNYIIYDCNVQRLLFINSNGKCRIWGKIPSKIQLHYVTEWGERKHSLLLTAGWWSVARHFHLAPEIGLAICWSLPVLFKHVRSLNNFPFFVLLTFLGQIQLSNLNFHSPRNTCCILNVLLLNNCQLSTFIVQGLLKSSRYLLQWKVFLLNN
jgi:hypothetical protein